jgi:hypothetical protein
MVSMRKWDIKIRRHHQTDVCTPLRGNLNFTPPSGVGSFSLAGTQLYRHQLPTRTSRLCSSISTSRPIIQVISKESRRFLLNLTSEHKPFIASSSSCPRMNSTGAEKVTFIFQFSIIMHHNSLSKHGFIRNLIQIDEYMNIQQDILCNHGNAENLRAVLRNETLHPIVSRISCIIL